ncbi:T9SS type A sorting domain-containing protein [Spirosoma soli]|uniref:T9SS type A sorting domain-containing protein n=1 Tax=Spirosoma soli TaxID=1770529 RepID=A0ABW5LZ93_9BACT
MTVLGNPISEQLRVRIEGVKGQTLGIQLTDVNGRLIENRTLESTQATEGQQFDVSRQQSGLLLLRTTSAMQSSTVKIIKR